MDTNKTDNDYKYGFSDDVKYSFNSGIGLTKQKVQEISHMKSEPEWMTNYRLKAYEIFNQRPMPSWGGDLSTIDFESIHYYIKPTDKQGITWDDVPENIKNTFEKLGIPEAERKFLAGVSAQYESEVVYHSLIDELEKQGVIFLDMDSALREYPDIVKQYFGTVIPSSDNKFAALNSSVWSGGSFVYIPKGVHVKIPLQAYFRINARNMGQFERTLIIADEGSYVHYVEGCTSPTYSTDSLHSAVVEIIAKKGARVRYSTIQNWYGNVYNLVTKRAHAYEDATVEWIDGNLGSKLTMKYPSIYLLGRGAHGITISAAVAGKGQHQDAGAKMIHIAPDTTSEIISKSISRNGGKTTYRGMVQIGPNALRSKSKVKCDALLLDELSSSDTVPTIQVSANPVTMSHEASTSRISEKQLFYLMSRGIDLEHAESIIVNGFIEPFVRELPMEYAVELNRLINLEMIGSIG